MVLVPRWIVNLFYQKGRKMKKAFSNQVDILDLYCKEMSRRDLKLELKQAETSDLYAQYHSLQEKLSVENITASERIAINKKSAKIVEYVTSSCLPYVVKLAKDFAQSTTNPDHNLLTELIAAGNLGLVTAFYKFKPSFGAPFHYYASNWIKAKIRESLRQNHNLIKNAPPNSTSIYFDGFPPGASVPEDLQEPSVDYTGGDQSLVYKADLRENVRRCDPLQQFVFNMHGGLITNGTEKYTTITRVLGKGFTTAFVKSKSAQASAIVRNSLSTRLDSSSGMR